MNLCILTADYEYKRWRAVLTLVGSFAFKELFRAYGTPEVQKMIDSGNIEGLRKWVKTVKYGDISEKNLTELRKLAGRKHIKHYCTLTKVEILRKLQQAGVTE